MNTAVTINQSSMIGDTSRVSVLTTNEHFFSDQMQDAPLGKTLLLINEGGCLCFGKVTHSTIDGYTEWMDMPLKASHENNEGKFQMSADMGKAPLNKRILLLNKDGGFCQGVLTHDNVGHFSEWQLFPQRAKNSLENREKRKELARQALARKINELAETEGAEKSQQVVSKEKTLELHSQFEEMNNLLKNRRKENQEPQTQGSEELCLSKPMLAAIEELEKSLDGLMQDDERQATTSKGMRLNA